MTSCTCLNCRRGTSTSTATRTPRRTTRTARKATAAGSAGGVPTREQADQMAAALPANRTGWDGKPLDDKGRRLYALRESGYTGPIDQHGYPDTTSEAAGTLRRMAHDRGETTTW
jgi:hypothetical protein